MTRPRLGEVAADRTDRAQPCRLCGGRRFELVRRACRDRRLNTPGAFDIVRCHGCGLMRTEPPRPAEECGTTGHSPGIPGPRAFGRGGPGSHGFHRQRTLTPLAKPALTPGGVQALTPGPSPALRERGASAKLFHARQTPLSPGPLRNAVPLDTAGRGRGGEGGEGPSPRGGEGLPRQGRAAAWALYRLRYGPADALPSPWPGAGRALDIGCGRGVLLAHLRAMGWDVWGIEPDAEAAAAAERAVGLPGRIAWCPAEEAVYPPAFFHLVTLTHSLEHLDEPLMVLMRVRRWLRPDGVLRVRVPDIASAEARLFGHLWHGLDVPRHRHHFTASTLTLLLARAGFVVHRRVPEAQAALLAGSLATLARVVSGRPLPSRAVRALYLLTVPVAASLAAFGIGGSIDVTAVPRS